MATDRRTIRFPLPMSQKIICRAKVEHLDFTSIVVDLCRRQLEEDDSRENAKAAALYSKAAFLAVSELLALAKKEDAESVRRALLARAGRRDDRGVPGPRAQGGAGTRPGQGLGARDRD